MSKTPTGWGDKKPYRSDLDEAFRLAKMRPLIKWDDLRPRKKGDTPRVPKEGK